MHSENAGESWSSQQVFHLRRHENGRPQDRHVFDGKCALARNDPLALRGMALPGHIYPIRVSIIAWAAD